jgi:DNA-binding LacI/PurR family transcriptional regulator
MRSPLRVERLAEELRRTLAAGRLLPSERVLAETHQVSRETVRIALRMLADRGLVAPRSRSGTRALASGPTGPIHLLYCAPRGSDPEADPFLGGIAFRLAEAGRPLRVVRPDPDDDPVDRLAAGGWGALSGGVVAAGIRLPIRRLEGSLGAAGIPLVVLGEVPPGLETPSVLSDQGHCGGLAARHLAGHGRRRLALVHGPWSHAPARLSREGFLTAAEEMGVAATAHEVACWDREAGRRAVLGLAATGRPPDGLVIAGDLAGSGALAALQELGLAVPAAVAVIAVGMPLHAARLLSVTAFVGDLAGHARAALDLLAHPRPGATLVPSRLLPGITCGCPRR